MTTEPIVKYCPINHHDTRGIIRDIFPDAAPESVTLITQRAGSVRGNHMHERSTQHLFVVSGGIVTYHTEPFNLREIHAIGMGAGAMITHAHGVAHAYRALVDSVLLAFASGVRKGDDYAEDTRQVPSLIEAYQALQDTGVRPLGMTVVGDPW